MREFSEPCPEKRGRRLRLTGVRHDGIPDSCLHSRAFTKGYVTWTARDSLVCLLVIPHILEDSRRTIDAWGYSGKVDPFERISEVRTPV